MPISPEEIEKRIHQALLALPEIPAPPGLEERVLAELARRARLPWWRRSYAHWPVAVRAGFLALSGAAAAVLVAGLVWLGRGGNFSPGGLQFNLECQWLVVIRAVASSLGHAAAQPIRAVPPLWLCAGLAAVATCCAALAGMGAAACRALLPAREIHQPFFP
jgi:hypothetical protein